MVEPITMYETEDGQHFAVESDARRHEVKCLIYKWCEESGICQGGGWEPDMVAASLIADAEKLATLLQNYIGEHS